MTEIEMMLKQTLPFWEELTVEQRALFCKYSVTTGYMKGDTVFNPLKKNEGLKIVWEGQMRISMLSVNGAEIMLYRLSGREICVLSVLSLMHQFDWNIYAEADEDSIVISIPAREYLRVSEENPVVKEYNHITALQRMGEVIQITGGYAMASTTERLADLLLRYQRQKQSMELVLTHDSLAKDMGTAREVVTRTLKEFQNQDLVRTGRGKILLLDLDGLEKVKKA